MSSYTPPPPYAPHPNNINGSHEKYETEVQAEYGIPNENNNEKDESSKHLGGAAFAGALAGLAIAGPVLGVVGGAAAVGLASSEKGTAGDVARSSGAAMEAVGERAKQIDQDHHVIEKTKKAAGSTAKKVKEVDEKHGISLKAKSAMDASVKRAKEIDEKHHVVDKTKEAGKKVAQHTAKGFSYLADKLKKK